MCNRTSCPFVKTPFDDCYVSNMSSSSIGEAVYYCGGNFRECEIFRSHAELAEAKEGSNPLRRAQPDTAEEQEEEAWTEES